VSTEDPRILAAKAELANIGINTALALAPMPGAGAAVGTARLLPEVSGLLPRAMRFGEAPLAEVLASRAPMAEELASRSPVRYDAPIKPQLPIEAQYPRGVPTDAAGRITHDRKGRKLIAEYIVGRNGVGNSVGQPEKALSPEEFNALAEKITGGRPESVEGRAIGGDAGRYSKRPGDRVSEIEHWNRPDLDDGWLRRIYLRNDLTPEQEGRVLPHEVGHAMEDRAGAKTIYKDRVPFGAMPEEGLDRQLAQVYHDLNDPTWRRGQLTPPRLQTTPRDLGYRSPEDIRAERWAEAFRGAMTNPNYMKTVNPDLYQAIADAVNAHPTLSKIIQFNALAPFLLGGVDSTSSPIPQVPTQDLSQ
jgi:hypothetical protein